MMDHWEDETDDRDQPRSGLRRIPVLTWPGLLLVLLAFATRDVRSLYVGGACLVIASIQWSFDL